MEPIEITVRFDLQGNPAPLNFTWQGKAYLVESTGRQWRDDLGQHVLVMIPGGRVFELIYVLAEGRWFLKPTSPQPPTFSA
jgi:hypothetical protein